jgi:hypothetical protein
MLSLQLLFRGSDSWKTVETKQDGFSFDRYLDGSGTYNLYTQLDNLLKKFQKKGSSVHSLHAKRYILAAYSMCSVRQQRFKHA